MSELILQTKLHIPAPRTSLVARPQLIEKLNAGLSGRLSLISAPPGFGKTTLVADWINQLAPGYKAGWLALEESDNDLARFFTYLIAALKSVFPQAGQELEQDQLPPPETTMAYLINDLTAVSPNVLLVLDDYHLLTTPAVHQAIHYLIEHSPPNLQLVIISRSDPPFSLSKLRVRGQLTEIRARDLRFSTAEAALFLRESMGLNLSRQEVTMLENRTEGWIAGLQLAAHSLRFQDNSQAFLTAFAGDDRYIADYLVEEVLNQQRPEIQSFLLQTSLLQRLSGDLCDALLERNGSQAILEQLEGSNLFIIPLDNRRQWYRYHQLFRDLLRERLDLPAEEIQALNLRASRWFAANQFMFQAVDHALAAEAYAQAANLIMVCVFEIFSTNQLATLLNWWSRIPQDLQSQNLSLCMATAWAWLAIGKWQEAERHLQLVESGLGLKMKALLTDIEDLDPRVRDGLIEVATIRVTFQSHTRVEIQETLALCRRILPYLVGNEEFLFNTAIALRPVVLFNMGLAHQTLNQLEEAETAFQEAIRLGEELGNGHLVAPALGELAEVQMIQGRLKTAETTCMAGITLLSTMTGKLTPLSGLLHVRLGQLYHEWNDLDLALEHYQRGIKLAQPWQHQATLLAGYLGLATTYLALDRQEECASTQASLVQLMNEQNTLVDDEIRAHTAWLLARQGDMEGAVYWLNQTHLERDQEPLLEQTALFLATTRHLLGENEEARRWLERLLELVLDLGHEGLLIQSLVLRSMIFGAFGKHEEALDTLVQALDKAEAQGYLRTFADQGTGLVTILEDLEEQGRLPPYGRVVLAAFRHPGQEFSTPEIRSGPVSSGGDGLVEPLTERELEILQYIAGGLANKEIAARLHLSTGTVKVHAHNIYSKLDVNGRTQAVVKAQQLKII